MVDDLRIDINGLRGLSVALVVAYHVQLKGAGGGLIGLEVFFLISGHLMTKVIWRGRATDRFSFWAGTAHARLDEGARPDRADRRLVH